MRRRRCKSQVASYILYSRSTAMKSSAEEFYSLICMQCRDGQQRATDSIITEFSHSQIRNHEHDNVAISKNMSGSKFSSEVASMDTKCMANISLQPAITCRVVVENSVIPRLHSAEACLSSMRPFDSSGLVVLVLHFVYIILSNFYLPIFIKSTCVASHSSEDHQPSPPPQKHSSECFLGESVGKY